MSSNVKELLSRHRLTVEEYHRMGEIGILRADARVELIEGEIIDMTPIGSRHAGSVRHLARILERELGDSAIISIQNPVVLGDVSEAEPDIALLRPRADFYKSAHPRSADVLLIVEVADASIRYDRQIKIPLYSRYGIAEVWIVDLDGNRLVRHRDPTEGGSARFDIPDVRESLGIGALPDIALDLSALFAD